MGVPKTCIIGAGISGLAAMRALQAADLPFVCYEAGSGIGGLWRYENDNGMSNIYRSLHTNTSRQRTGFSSFPMSDEYPDFPRHDQVLAYLEEFVDHFGLHPSIKFRHRVEHVGKRSPAGFAVTVTRPDGAHQLESFDAVVVANGHHWKPYMPLLQGSFSGQLIHSSRYRTPLDYLDQRVLVIGSGNSASDIVADLAGLAETVSISTRRGAHVVPKYVLGRPIDQWTSHTTSRLPKSIQRRLFQALLFLARGRQSSYGFPSPPNPLGTEHPTITSDLLPLIGHGKVKVRPAIERLEGDTVVFADETSETYDAVIMATGFDVVFPFLDEVTLRVVDNRVDLFQHVIHPGINRMFFVGFIQPLGAIAPLVEAQAEWIADILNGRCQLPDADAMWSAIEAQHAAIEKDFVPSRRHTFEVDFFNYLREIQAERNRRDP